MLFWNPLLHLTYTNHISKVKNRFRIPEVQSALFVLPIFCVAGPPNQPTQLLPGIQFLGCSATFQGTPMSPSWSCHDSSWQWLIFFRHHEPCLRCHKLFILVKNHVSKKSEICCFFINMNDWIMMDYRRVNVISHLLDLTPGCYAAVVPVQLLWHLPKKWFPWMMGCTPRANGNGYMKMAKLQKNLGKFQMLHLVDISEWCWTHLKDWVHRPMAFCDDPSFARILSSLFLNPRFLPTAVTVPWKHPKVGRSKKCQIQARKYEKKKRYTPWN